MLRRGDLIAGLTVWAVLVPESLAYASIAGVSPVVGLYEAPPALVLYAILGTSKHLIVGPMSATAALSAAAVAPHFGLTPVLAIVTGVVALGAGLLRLGFLANFISEPVLKGFIVGLALTIVAGQLPKLFGVEKGEGDFFEADLAQERRPVHSRPRRAEHDGDDRHGAERDHDGSTCPRSPQPSRAMQRKPMWLVDVSTASNWRAAGR